MKLMKLMKLMHYGLTSLILCIATIANAENIAKNLSQENNNFFLKLQKGDIISVNFDLRRNPIFRQHEWYSYVLKCQTSEKSKISYPLRDQHKTAYGRIMLSHDDGQLVCSKTDGKWCVDAEIDDRGVLTIENISNKENGLECKLYNKIGQ